MGGNGGFVDSVESILGGTFGLTRGRVMFWALVGRHGGWVSGLRCLGLEQQEKPGNVFSLVALGPPSGVVAALTEPVGGTRGFGGGLFGPLSPVASGGFDD